MAIDGSRIRRMLDGQDDDLARLTDRQARDLLRAFEDARRELAERLRSMQAKGLDDKTPWTAQHLRVTLAQVEAGIQQVEDRLGRQLDEATKAQRQRAKEDLLEVLGGADPDFQEVGQRLEMEVAAPWRSRTACSCTATA